jgi:hypothetical protein
VKRAFSALTSAVRVPSPLGWAGMKGAFGARRCAGAVTAAQTTNQPSPSPRSSLEERGSDSSNTLTIRRNQICNQCAGFFIQLWASLLVGLRRSFVVQIPPSRGERSQWSRWPGVIRKL